MVSTPSGFRATTPGVRSHSIVPGRARLRAWAMEFGAILSLCSRFAVAARLYAGALSSRAVRTKSFARRSCCPRPRSFDRRLP